MHHQLQKALDVINDTARHHPDDSMLAENRVYLRCMEGKLTPADIQRLDAILRVAPFDSGGFNNMETLRKLAFGGQCPALNPHNWLHLTDTLLANPAYGHNGIAAGFLHYQRHYWAVSKGNLGMAIRELDKTYQFDPDAEIPRLKAKYLASAGLYDQAIAALRDTDVQRLPLLRRLLVDDRAINRADIRRIQAMKRRSEHAGASARPAPAASTAKP